jgi:putative ABC transport system ATP-binding protein
MSSGGTSLPTDPSAYPTAMLAPVGGAVAPPVIVARPPLIELRSIWRVYQLGNVVVEALRGVDLVIRQGEFVAIIGPSGSGKTTLMNIIGCLDRPSAGSYRLAGQEVAALDDDGLAQVRSRTIGFVFQSYNLLSRTTALENVETPLLYQGVGRGDRERRATEALIALGMGERLRHFPSELSGGQQQRVAIARALVTQPALILADEPTGNLDSSSGADVMRTLADLHRGGSTIVLITHDPEVAAAAERQVHVRDGRLLS